ncbi:MAG TPA: alpha/beta hydrolase family protein [Thermoleophilia bacterium]|nr:alpha/beta hydrolase family protein [Thermoleophilia bacterium]
MERRVATIDGVAVEHAVAGNGTPAIVLLNGAGGPIEGWYRVLAPLAAVSTVVAYNRLGIGRSSKPSEPQTGDVVVRLLHALLQKLGLRPPHVLVGHSLGGLFVDLFARTYPDEVAAVVFLEAAAPEDSTLVDEHGTGFQRSAQRLVDAVFARDQFGEAACVPQTVDMIARAGAFPPVPVVVVSGGKPARGVPAAVRDARARNQAGLVALSPLGEHLVARRSGHFPQMSEPGLVSDAIRSVVASVRERNG